MPRLIMISPEAGAEDLGLMIAEIMLDTHAPEDLGATEALDQLETGVAERARKAGKIIHQMLTAAVGAALEQANETEEEPHAEDC